MNILSLKQVGPYMGVQDEGVKEFPKGKFRVVLYGAYNANGLIGPEYNGIAVLDEQARCVLLDNEAQISTGYYGASRKQKDRFQEVMAMDWEEFKHWVNNHERARHKI